MSGNNRDRGLEMTLEKIQAMSNEDLRIKVAELLGFIREFGWGLEDDPNFFVWFKNGEESCEPPDYPQDLNACHEMWLGTRLELQEVWMDMLYKVCEIEEDPDIQNPEALCWATARQRCEAFVLTMEAD